MTPPSSYPSQPHMSQSPSNRGDNTQTYQGLGAGQGSRGGEQVGPAVFKALLHWVGGGWGGRGVGGWNSVRSGETGNVTLSNVLT